MASSAASNSNVGKCLIVDDHVGIRGVLRLFVRKLGYAAIECANGQDALLLFEREAPDWVLMDLEMPVLDGLQATHAILQRDPLARVIVITQHADPIWREQALAAGARAFVLKEDLTRLGAMLTQALDQAS